MSDAPRVTLPVKCNAARCAPLGQLRRANMEGTPTATPEGARVDAGASSEADIHLERVTKRFGDAVAVDDLTLSIERGAFYALLGPSGCGKTTTLRMIGGVEG